MNRYISYIFSILLFSACSMESIPSSCEVGYISVELMADMPTKAPVALTDEEAGEYNIRVLDAEGNAAKYQAPEEKKGQDIPVTEYKDFETVTVEVGKTYSVTAESCTVAESEAGMGMPRYFGTSGKFELNASNIYQKSTIICSQTNALVTVVFDGSVSGRFTGLKVDLVSGARSLSVPESSEDVRTYFTPGAFSYSITGTYAETGYSVNIKGDPIQLQAKDNIRLVVRLDLTHGQAEMPSLTVTEEYASEQNPDYEIDPYMQ